MRSESIVQIRSTIIDWGKENYQDFPWRNTTEPWFGLIAEILLQRTRANNVVPVYYSFIKKFPTPEDLSSASIISIEECIHPLGLIWRASILKKLGEELSKLHGQIPEDYESIRKLPGVGDYVASAWLSFHGKCRCVIIDANIVRFLCQITGNTRNGETRRKKWVIDLAESLTPDNEWKSYNYSILDFTMLVCKKKPDCLHCPISSNNCNQKIKAGI